MKTKLIPRALLLLTALFHLPGAGVAGGPLSNEGEAISDESATSSDGGAPRRPTAIRG
ncbi:hypothetical protein ASALC70_00611 [Alcanivorax sp. ALC70]|nr:hypothetical protein ASALC70_00611 [Alcanivorax sp. ALC70]